MLIYGTSYAYGAPSFAAQANPWASSTYSWPHMGSYASPQNSSLHNTVNPMYYPSSYYDPPQTNKMAISPRFAPRRSSDPWDSRNRNYEPQYRFPTTPSYSSTQRSPQPKLGYKATMPQNPWESDRYDFADSDDDYYEEGPEHVDRTYSKARPPSRDNTPAVEVVHDNVNYYDYDPSARPTRSALRQCSDGKEMSHPGQNRVLNDINEVVLCHACGKFVDPDDGFKAEGRVFHSDHFVCHACHRPLGPHTEFFRHGDFYYCSTDFKKNFASRCVYCQREIRGHRLNNFYGEGICRAHQKESHITDCQDCGRIVPAQSRFRRRHSRTQCDVCQQTAVSNESQAKRLFALVRYTLDHEYHMGIRQVNVPLSLLTLEELRRESVGTSHSKMPKMVGGLTKCTYDGAGYNVKWIGVPQNMNVDRLAMVMAHELAHAFLFTQYFPLKHLGLSIEEGLCELICYLWMNSHGQRHKPIYHFWQDQMLRGTDRIYHDGFRTVKSSFDKFCSRHSAEDALPAFLSYIKKNKALP